MVLPNKTYQAAVANATPRLSLDDAVKTTLYQIGFKADDYSVEERQGLLTELSTLISTKQLANFHVGLNAKSASERELVGAEASGK
ncbi:MAG: hypothetical protein JWO41_838 [Candidatus Saccharibacteria bacterium]|nr:hypothetical protein [Candidatus Saccharibacteria bacterium]